MKYTLLLISFLIYGLAWSADPQVTHYPARPGIPLSDAVRVDHLLFLSGKLGNIPGTAQLAEGGIQAETRQALENIKASLESHGSSLANVVKCTVFLADITEWGAMNEVYKTYFAANPPARSAVGVNGLALGARVEIECIATVD